MAYGALLRRNAPFRWYWAGSTLSMFGDAVFAIALPLLVLEVTGSVLGLSLAIIVQILPSLLFGFLIGVAADRFDQKRLMIAADAVRAALLFGLLLLMESGRLHVGFIYVFLFLLNVCSILFDTARHGVLQRNVESDQYTEANALLTMSQHSCDLLGKALGGVFVALADPSLALGIDAATFVLSLLCLTVSGLVGVIPEAASRLKRSIGGDLRDGFHVLLRQKQISRLILYLFALNVAVAPLGLALPLLVTEQAVTAAGFGFMAGCLSLGSVVGSYSTAFLERKVRPGRLIPLSILMYAVCVPLAAVPIPLAGKLLVLFCAGVASDVAVVLINSAIQRLTPPEYIGRISAFKGTALRLGIPLVLLLSSTLFPQIGNASTMAIFSVVCLFCTIALARRRSSSLEDRKREVLDQ